MEKARLDNGRFVCGVDRHVTDTSSGGENEGKIGRVKKTKKGFKTAEFDNFELVFAYY